MFVDIKRALAIANKPTLLFAIVSILPVVGFAPHFPTSIIYAVAALYSAFCLSKQNGFDALMVLFLVYIPIELIIVQPPSVFRSWPRYVFFVFLLMNVSPLLRGKRLRLYREQLFHYVMLACVLIGVGSFFARFLGINYMVVGYNDLLSNTGRFGGLTTHSMLLGPVAGIGACYLANNALLKKKTMGWLWMTLALFSVLFSASRSSLLAAITGVIVTVYYRTGTTSKFAKYAIAALIIGSSTFSLWEGALGGMIEKNGSATSLNYDSRQALWDERIDEFYSNPIVGVGFCATDIYKTLDFDIQSGRVEAGSSWLIIFSMLGIIGALIVFPILFRAFKLARRRKDDLSAVLNGVLALFFIHMFAEGYIFAGGSFLAFMLWLTVGVATDSKFVAKR